MPFPNILICTYHGRHVVAEVYKNRFLEDWAEMTRIRKPIIAAVSGYAVCQRFPLYASLILLFFAAWRWLRAGPNV